jgi:hypothetical protein
LPTTTRATIWAAQTRAEHVLRVIAPIFKQGAIPLCPIKGVVLGRWLYDDVVDRPLSDVDLLVRPRERAALREAARKAGWRLVRASEELHELAFCVQGVVIEAHAEVVRRDLTALSADDLIERCSIDSTTFGFEIHRLDDLDHLIWLVVEVVKDWFVEANAHQPADLERLLARLLDRRSELIDRAQQAGFMTGLYNAARWMAEEHGSVAFRELLDWIGRPPRQVQPYVVRWLWKRNRPCRTLGLAASCFTNDVWSVRARCLGTIMRRRLFRAAGLDPR